MEQDGIVYVAALPDGPPLVLEGSGALVWRALLGGGTVDEVVTRVAEAAGESAAAVAPAVTRFLDDLVARRRPRARSPRRRPSRTQE